MPRQVDLTPQNMQLTHDPNNQIGMSTSQLAAFQAQQPALVAKALATSINMLLKGFTDQINLDLKAFADGLAALFPDSSNVVEAFLDWLNQLSPEITQLQEDFRAGNQAFTTFLNAVWNAFIGDTDFTSLLTDLQTAWNTYAAAAAGIEADETLTLQKMLQKIIDDLLKPLSDWLTPGSPLYWGNIFGIGNISSAWITDTPPNPLLNPGFRGAISMAPGSGWSWDSTVYYVDPDGDDGSDPGSAKCVADGGVHGLRSNPFDVQGGQSIPVDVHVLTSGLVCTGTPVRVDVLSFFVDSEGNESTVGSVSPADLQMGAGSLAPADWVGAPAGSFEGKLTGSFTVPNDGTVNRLRLRLVVDTGATGGVVWFDKAAVTLQGGLIADLQGDLSKSSAAWSTLLQSAWTDLTANTSWATKVAALQADWDTFAAAFAGIQADETLTLQKIINEIFHIGTDGTIDSSFLSGLDAVLNDLGVGPTDISAINGDITSLQGAQSTANTAFSDLLTALGQALTQDPLFSAQQASDITTAWTDYMAILAGTREDTNDAYQDILARLLGIDGTLDHSKVNGLQSFIDGVLTALGVDAGTIAKWDAVSSDVQAFLTTWSWTDLSHAWTDLNTALWGGSSGAVGSLLQTSAVPNLPTSHITGLDAQLADLVADFNTAVTTGDWNPIMQDLFGTTTPGSAATVQPSALPAAWAAVIADITSFLTTGNWNALGDAWSDLNQALWGQGTVGTTVQQSAIPGGIDQGKVAGLPDVWTQINAAFNGDVADSGDWSWMAGLVNDWNDMWTGTRSDATDSKNKLAARNNSPTYEGLDDTTSANMPLASVSVGVSPIGSTEIAFVRLKQDYPADTPLRAVGFIAVASAEPTTFYVNLRTFDPDTGALKFHAGSTNINALIPVGSSVDDSDWVQYDFGVNNALTGKMGDLVAVEFQSSGTSANLAGRSIAGTFSQMGKIPVHPTKKLKNYAADVTKASYPIPSTIDLTSADYAFHGDNLPYVALEITGVTSDPVVQPDRSASYTSSSSLTLASWVKFVDLVGVGAGGGGQHTVLSVNGVGGDAGTWNSKTLTVGTDIAVGGVITISVGAGGNGGVFVQNGSTGGSTTFSWTTPGGQTRTLVAAGGPGGGAGSQVTSFGEGAGNTSWNGRVYYGGAQQANNAAGNPPGGGGAGGVAFTATGKNGARGQAWTVERQS